MFTDNSRYIIATIKTWNIERAMDYANTSGLNIEIITNPEELNIANIRRVDPKYIFFPHWSWKIPSDIYEKWECVVFHMTDLPYGRGGSPLQNLIVRGCEKTKISALRVVEDIDAGPIYLKEDLDLSGRAEDIFIRASNIVYSRMIPLIVEKRLQPSPQAGEPVVFNRRRPNDSDLSNVVSAKKIYDHIRMLDAEGYPKAYLDSGYAKYEFSNAVYDNGKLTANVEIIVNSKEVQKDGKQ